VQTEYSLWTRNPEIAVLDACRALGTTLVAFSPLARGFLPGTLRDVSGFDAKDIRRAMPRFAPSNYAENLALLDGVAEVAREAGCSLAQLALAWLLHRGEHVLPIPGTTSIAHLEENLAAAQVTLTPAQMQRLDTLVHRDTVRGARYNAATQTEIDTEEF
jgi:aryl-alcohol dehydrogenase-like predicted oxidoreductase